jgi:hypothetical protein
VTVVWINGPFGIGKTTTASLLAQSWEGAAAFDPEELGPAAREWDRTAADFQDIPVWRELTVRGVTDADRAAGRVVVPMTLLRPAYYVEVMDGLRAAGVEVHHFCLIASRDETLRRAAQRADHTLRWVEAMYESYSPSLADPLFAEHVDIEGTPAESVAHHIHNAISQRE